MARLEFGNLRWDTINKESREYGEESIRVERRRHERQEEEKHLKKKNYGYNKK
jgi:hypothetical protein